MTKPLTFPLTMSALADAGRRIDARDCLLVGLTGGIASGKSTVSRMLKDLGAPLVDFDVLARQVVTPGKAAYLKIVASFGRTVLLPDGMLDRKRLSRIVFGNPEKRKKLEGFTHPAIFEAFFDAVSKISAEDPESIIQIAVPLLMELELHSLFHKIVLVYVSERTQLVRLMKRDGIDRRHAEKILAAQIPMDKKRASADCVIYNDGPVDETRKQVEVLWQDLLKRQKNPRTDR